MTIPDSEQRCTPEEESRVIKDLTEKAESNAEEGDTYYLLSARWYASWQEYTGQSVDAPVERPGPINNADLVSEAHDPPQLLRTVQETTNYVLLPEEAWTRLHGWYNGGPVIARKMIAAGRLSKNLYVEVFPLCLNLVDSRNDTCCVIQLSRKATLNELYEVVCQAKGLETDKVRIFDYWKCRKILSLPASDRTTLGDARLIMDQDILLELQGDHQGSRPFRSSFSGPSTSDMDMDMDDGNPEEGRKGLAGLQNLGNTCFMNSSLQCLAHTPPIMEYFMQDYSDEINRENPLGMRGELALAFGNLLRKLWSGRGSSFLPRAFKQKLAHFAPQFDSQELLAFLLDGLHEDLNRVKKKPYIEKKDSDGRADEDVADEYWSNHKARNDSIIVDVCQGQYKSTLVCPSCNKTSITFDPFMYLSLPLPSKATRAMTVTVFSGDGTALPAQFTVTVPKYGSCKDLVEALGTECCLGSDEYLVLAAVCWNKVRQYFEDSSELDDIRDTAVLVAYRLPKRCTDFTRLEISHRFLQKPVFKFSGSERKHFLTPLVTFLEDPQSKSDIDQAVARVLAPFSDELVSLGLEPDTGTGPAQNPDELVSLGFEPDTGKEHAQNPDEVVLGSEPNTGNPDELVSSDPEPDKGTGPAQNPDELVSLGPEPGTGTGPAQNPDELVSLGPEPDTGTGPAQNPDELVSSGPEPDTGRGPEDTSAPSFKLCLITNDFGKCHPISPGETCMEFGREVKVFLDWTGRDHESYDASYLNDEDLPRVDNGKEEDAEPEEAISLFSCLDAFLKEEPLGPEDTWYCPECKEHRQASKKLDLWRLPDVLVFHLKRFSYKRWMKKKLDTLVEFPVRNLDLTDYANGGGDNVYELYAISNHYGGLGGGHYTAYCKLIDGDNKWYHFDDGRVSQISEDDITTPAAYVLFYRRVGSKSDGTVS